MSVAQQEAILTILRDTIRLVARPDYEETETWMVKPGCLETCAQKIADGPTAALVAERDALRKAAEWQPIETAPKGWKIIGLGWVPEQGGPEPEVFMSWYSDEHWVRSPTHWKPISSLPSAPRRQGS